MPDTEYLTVMSAVNGRLGKVQGEHISCLSYLSMMIELGWGHISVSKVLA